MNAKNALNFSGGPGILPPSVLLEAQQALAAVPEIGLSVLGISHRSAWFAGVVAEAEHNIRSLLNLPETHAVLFLQGGGSLQFCMVPMLLLRGSGRAAEYLRTGYWSAKAIPEAACEGRVVTLWDGQTQGFRCLPSADQLSPSPEAAYLHYVSNETVEGTQFHGIPGLDTVPRVCDMSSDFLSRPFDPKRFDLIYAHAQKNIGPAGVTVVIIKKSLLDHVPAGLPKMLDYRAHLDAHSIYNTPPVFAIYVTMLVTRWLLNDIGGLNNMAAINAQKAAMLYALIDAHPEVYQGFAHPQNRSQMNVVFTLASPDLEAKFLAQSSAQGFSGLAGHRTLGGVRASIYNAMSAASVAELCAFMQHFAQQ